MKPRLPRWIYLVLAVAMAGLGVRWLTGSSADPERGDQAGEQAPNRLPRMVFRNGKWERLDGRELEAFLADMASRTPGLMRVSGTVRDSESGQPVPGAEVVFASELGESSTTAGDDGSYFLEIPAGFYRAFARAEGYVAVGRTQPERLPGQPDASVVGMPRAELAPLLGVFRDQTGVDMHLRGGAEIVGTIYDAAGRPVSGAVIMGRLSGYGGSQVRLILGSDMDESDLDGSFRLEVPAGPVTLMAAHDQFAGLTDTSSQTVYVNAGESKRVDLTLAEGCIIAGRVVDSRGRLVGEGSLEVWNGGEPPNDYVPVGQLVGGRFRLARTGEETVRLRAWPWKSPHTQPQEFSCRDGYRYDDVTLVVPDAVPDLEGSVVSRGGEPLADAYIDIFPLDMGGMAQQERADIYGDWAFYSLPPGQYRVMAYVHGHGAAAKTVVAPSRGIKLALSGTGSISGTAEGMNSGTFTFAIERCQVGTEDGGVAVFDEYSMPRTTRLVPVVDGTFHIEDVPACLLSAMVSTPSRSERVHLDITPGGVTRLSFDLRAARPKTLYGVVMDGDRVPVSGVAVSRIAGPGSPPDHYAYAVTDAEGRYELEVFTGDRLFFRGPDGWAEVEVSWSSDDRERRDVTLRSE